MANFDQMLVYVVDVGQGQMTYVECWKQKKLTNTLLFDCGTTKNSANTHKNIQWVGERLKLMTTPVFDLVVFSHSDTDHINKMVELLNACPKGTKITKVLYGGNYSDYTKGKAKFNILDYLMDNKYCYQIEPPSTSYTAWVTEDEKFNEALWDEDNISVYLLVANVPAVAMNGKKRKRPSPEELNRVSVVCYLIFEGEDYDTAFVIAGDATNETMATVNKYLDTAVLSDIEMSTLPHHGSRNTGLAVKSGKVASLSAINTVKKYVAGTASTTYTYSSQRTNHKHPSLELLDYFVPDDDELFAMDPRLKTKDTHLITANVDFVLQNPAGDETIRGYTTFATKSNTYGTLYQYNGSGGKYGYRIGAKVTTVSAGLVKDVPMNPGACWVYDVDKDGKFSLEGFAKLGDAAFTEDPDDDDEMGKRTFEKRKSAPRLSAKTVESMPTAFARTVARPSKGKAVNVVGIRIPLKSFE
jgi:hypothetical protein